MSRISIIFHLLVFVSIGLLQNVRADDPQDLVKARKSYREKMERATDNAWRGPMSRTASPNSSIRPS